MQVSHDGDNDGVSVAVGYNPRTLMTKLFDGQWRITLRQDAGVFRDVVFCENIEAFIAVGNGDSMYLSPNGYAWTAHAIPNGDWRMVDYSTECGVALAITDDGFLTLSHDGVDWSTPIDTGVPDAWLFWDDARHCFVIRNDEKEIISINGKHWEEVVKS
jgi:hypothetical protein